MDTRGPMLSSPQRNVLAGGVGKKGKDTNVSANLFSTHYQVPHGASSSKAIEPQSHRMHKLLQVYSIDQLSRTL